MTKMQLSSFVKNLLNAWQNRDAEALETMYSKDVIGHMDDKTVHYKDIMARLQFSIDSFSNVTNELLDLIIDGEKAAARIKQTMIRRKDDNPTVYYITAIYHVVNEQVIETWSSFYPNVNYLDNN